MLLIKEWRGGSTERHVVAFATLKNAEENASIRKRPKLNVNLSTFLQQENVKRLRQRSG